MFILHNALTIKPIADLCAKAPAPEKIEELYDGKGRHLMVESVTLDDIERTYFDDMDTDEHGAMMLEAITTSKMRLERTMSAFAKALNQQLQGTNLQAGAPELGRVRKTGGVAIMPAVMSLSDGQSITVMFHSPTNDPSKISTDDTLVAFRFLLNKRDVTHVVSPDGGKDISLKQTCLSLANLAEKNTAKFQAAQERANKLKTDLENYRAQAAQLDEQAAQLIDQGDKLKAKEGGNQAELATITAKADKQEQLNNELRKQLEAAQAKAKATSEGSATPPAAAGNGGANKTLELAKKAIQEAYSHQKSADKITATIERRGESARLTFNRNSYHTMRTKALSQAEELFTKYVQQGGTAADWDAGVPEEMEGVASYEFMLAKTGAQPAAQPAGATTPPAGTGDDGAITAGKPIQRLVTTDEYIAILGDKVDDVSRTGWALHAGKGDYAGQFVLSGGNDGQRKVIAVGFTSQDEAIQWAKENRRNKVGLEKQSAKLNDFKKMLAAADRAYEQASGKTLTADAVIDSKADAEQQDKQKAAFAHVITDAAKSILSYASSQGIPLNPSLSNVSARNLVASALGVTTGRDTLPDNIDADISIEPNEKLVFDGSALVNGKVSVDEFIRVLKSYGGRYAEAEAEAEVDDNGGQEQLLADAKEYLSGATLPADITKQTPADYIRSKMKEDFEARESYFLKYAKAIGSTNAVMGLYAQHLGSVDKNKTLEQLKAMAISQYAKEVNGLPRDTVFSQEMMRGAVNEPALEKQISGWARQFFNWDENLSSKTVMDSTDNVLASLVKEKATAKIKELIADVAKETLPDGLHKMANSAGDIADAQSINGVSVKMPSLTFAYDTTGKPSKNEFKKSGVIVSPDFNEAGEATGYRVTHNGSTQVFNSWEGMKETVFKLAGVPEKPAKQLPNSKELEQKLDAMQFGTKELKDYVPAGLSGDEVKSQLSAISRMYAHMDAAFRDVNALFGKTTRERMLGHYFGFDDYTAHQLANAETSGTDLGGTRIAKVPDNGSMLDAEKLANGEYTKAELMNMFGIKDYSTNSDNSAADTGSDAGDDTNAKAVTDAVSALERIRDANVANMSLQEVNDAAAEIERLINTLMELGAYTENESLAEAATQPLVDRMMELAA